MSVGVGLVVLSWGVVACDVGSEERSYALPSEFCGLSLAEDLYEPLFPNGSELQVGMSFDDFSDGTATRYCSLSVDDDEFVRINADGTDEFEHAVVDLSTDVEMSDAESVPGEFDALVWPGVAMAKAPCTVPGVLSSNRIDTLLVTLETDHPGDDDESVRVLSDLIQPLMTEALKATPCQENEERFGAEG
ncbi:hypothetical protein [Streptomyces sp. URMC 129]|uniref:hypothetical protein n=1 Tax=Streptomyces sp. URMC 129 TaxID=3423407 RepID=UPI003F1DEBFA